ncbi:DUF4301 family protein [Reichenbachiella sp. MALMAid0571]|uniref:DUF4301 family protein n=1 Tax=Reichenbachiella sp. MALMAid0571 TaxID=3143939 RepID=UPI0032DF9094
MFSEQEKKQIEERGSDIAQVEQQVENFINGFPFLNAGRAASVGDGILKFSDDEVKHYQQLYVDKSKSKKIIKFVPASGAASRMFKELFAFLEDKNFEKNKAVQQFIAGLSNFAFYDELVSNLKSKRINVEKALEDKDYSPVISELLSSEGMDYGSLPKGLLKFHRYGDRTRTPAEEHFSEGASYAVSDGNVVYLHFTVSPEHQEKFEKHVNEIKPYYEQLSGVTYEVTFSQQKKSTDTIAVDLDNKPFKEEEKILFRPAGHGALLSNLNDLDGDVVFIKNVDNVVPDKLKESTILYKQVIGGLLLELQDKVFELTQKLKDGNSAIKESEQFLRDKINLKLPESYADMNAQEKVKYLLSKLDRPIRVCGMVKNTGEPGGGPFWVKDQDGTEAIQIGETAQIDLSNPDQANMLKNSTHFSPTDLVCGIKDRNGNKYDLMEHRDPQTGFITSKSKSGRDLKAQELPGLWNGSMANWNSVMVEVPLSTFNPVKTVNDLLKPAHQ